MHTGHHQQKYPETEEDCVTDRQNHNHGIESRLIFVHVFSFSTAQPTDQPTKSTLQGVQELMKKEKEKKRKSELLLLPTQTEQNRDNTSVGGHESCTEQHWLAGPLLALFN